ncbi:MAG TPA: tRNA pseudouridine(55) synthase TruB [Candidatus Binatia bacterium]|nr:tRNA pseudouridine(55) synthase TruB [Candidatus Binatia bacterium]
MLGFVNLFKPPGPSSTQLGARVRRIYSSRVEGRLAVGHVGTLDPQAAGVLPLALGKATRLIPLIEDRRKAYVCTLVLGRMTTTADGSGETVATSSVPDDAVTRLNAALPSFIGRIEQIPPMFSAVHHGGMRLYDLARMGKTVERRKRTVTIYAITLLGREPAALRLRVACSEGTYIRTLCEDLGRSIGVAAHMGALLREASGPFLLSESVLLEDVIENPEGALIAPEHVIPFPTIVLDQRAASDFRLGRIVPLDGGSGDKHVFVRDSARVLVGVGETLGTLLAPRKVFV